MSDKKYVVPAAMTQAARDGLGHGAGLIDTIQMHIILSSAIQWLAENPIIPTAEWIIQHTREDEEDYSGVFAEWQKVMLLAPEPEVPDAVKDLLEPFAADGFPAMLAKSSIIEAYNRGKAGK